MNNDIQTAHEAQPLRGQLTDAALASEYILAGNATFTIVSKTTGARYTYKVRKPEDWSKERPTWFVNLLSGPDNESDYHYLGLIRCWAEDGRYTVRQTAKSRVGTDAPSFNAIKWALGHVLNDDVIPSQLELWHEGRCGRCGRKLTVPESVARGLGPECATRA